MVQPAGTAMPAGTATLAGTTTTGQDACSEHFAAVEPITFAATARR